MIFLSALAFIVLLTLLILIHELGHYFLARLFKVDVEEFGFGLPPKAKVLFRHDGTDFTLNWVPFGGFVRMKGENAIDGPERFDEGSFARASLSARFAILFGGVAMNFLLALFLLTIGFSVGRWVPSWYASVEEFQAARDRGEITATLAVVITNVVPGEAADRAGVPKDMVITSIDGMPVETPEDVIALQKDKSSVTYLLTDQHDGTSQEVTVVLSDGKAGVEIQAAVLDLAAPMRPVPLAFAYAVKESVYMSRETVRGIGNLFRSLFAKGEVPEGITGIVGIAILTHGSVQDGFMTYVRLVALLSLSLAILNILPLPALDGGRILFVIMEWVIRRPLNRRFELMTNAVGFFLIIGLIVVITFNDILHLFSSA